MSIFSPPPKKPPPANGLTHGPMTGCACPWCGAPQDLRNMQETIGAALEPGAWFECMRCHKMIDLVKVIPNVTVVSLRQSKKAATNKYTVTADAAPPASPAQAIARVQAARAAMQRRR